MVQCHIRHHNKEAMPIFPVLPLVVTLFPVSVGVNSRMPSGTIVYRAGFGSSQPAWG